MNMMKAALISEARGPTGLHRRGTLNILDVHLP